MLPYQTTFGKDFSLVFHYSDIEFDYKRNGQTNYPLKYFGVPAMIFKYYNLARLSVKL